jgi:hypothetical protein
VREGPSVLTQKRWRPPASSLLDIKLLHLLSKVNTFLRIDEVSVLDRTVLFD